ncbi:hypothetical protein DAI22_11g095100 [Oryza sativa Japonica Group]|nr:hypothetical protein DAI22_11g095100 [Oryza sativa Japonica Group]
MPLLFTSGGNPAAFFVTPTPATIGPHLCLDLWGHRIWLPRAWWRLDLVDADQATVAVPSSSLMVGGKSEWEVAGTPHEDEI